MAADIHLLFTLFRFDSYRAQCQFSEKFTTSFLIQTKIESYNHGLIASFRESILSEGRVW